jgi:hypothetical protein
MGFQQREKDVLKVPPSLTCDSSMNDGESIEDVRHRNRTSALNTGLKLIVVSESAAPLARLTRKAVHSEMNKIASS